MMEEVEMRSVEMVVLWIVELVDGCGEKKAEVRAAGSYMGGRRARLPGSATVVIARFGR